MQTFSNSSHSESLQLDVSFLQFPAIFCGGLRFNPSLLRIVGGVSQLAQNSSPPKFLALATMVRQWQTFSKSKTSSEELAVNLVRELHICFSIDNLQNFCHQSPLTSPHLLELFYATINWVASIQEEEKKSFLLFFPFTLHFSQEWFLICGDHAYCLPVQTHRCCIEPWSPIWGPPICSKGAWRSCAGFTHFYELLFWFHRSIHKVSRNWNPASISAFTKMSIIFVISPLKLFLNENLPPILCLFAHFFPFFFTRWNDSHQPFVFIKSPSNFFACPFRNTVSNWQRHQPFFFFAKLPKVRSSNFLIIQVKISRVDWPKKGYHSLNPGAVLKLAGRDVQAKVPFMHKLWSDQVPDGSVDPVSFFPTTSSTCTSNKG